MTSPVFQDYPYWSAESETDIKTQLREMSNIRKDDITQISNLINIFISGRRVATVPSSSLDVVAGRDFVGDFNVTATYAYFLIETGGAGEWRRVAVGAW